MVRLLCCDLWFFVAATWRKPMTGKKQIMRHLVISKGFYLYLCIIFSESSKLSISISNILRITFCEFRLSTQHFSTSKHQQFNSTNSPVNTVWPLYGALSRHGADRIPQFTVIFMDKLWLFFGMTWWPLRRQWADWTGTASEKNLNVSPGNLTWLWRMTTFL